MKTFNVIILAGGEKGPLFETTGYVEKALIPIHGKPMVSRVIEAFHASSRVNRIVVVGSANLDALDAMQHVHKRIAPGLNVMQNLLTAVAYVKHVLYHSASHHAGYVISFCDAVFLTPEIIDETLDSIEQADCEIVLHYVEKSSFETAKLPTKRTYLPVAGNHYTGTTIYYVKKFSKVLAAVPTLHKLREHRKDPARMFQLIGCENADLPGIEQALGEELGASVRICVSPHARLGLDVDKPSDLELAKQVLNDA